MANSRATISSTAIFLSQQSRQYFSSPRGSETSLAPHNEQRALATVFLGMLQFTIYNPGCPKAPRGLPGAATARASRRGSTDGSEPMERPTHAGLRHLALNVHDLDAMKRFYVDLLGFAIEWEPDPDNIYLSSGLDNLALHRAAEAADPALADFGGGSALDHLGLIVRSAEDVDRW